MYTTVLAHTRNMRRNRTKKRKTKIIIIMKNRKGIIKNEGKFQETMRNGPKNVRRRFENISRSSLKIITSTVHSRIKGIVITNIIQVTVVYLGVVLGLLVYFSQLQDAHVRLLVRSL